MSKKCYNNYIESVEKGLRQDVNMFWKFVNSRKCKTGILNDMVYGNKRSDDPHKICNLFSNYFGSVCEESYSNEFNFYNLPPAHPNCEIISNISISLGDVTKILKSLDMTKGPGPDGIPPLFFKLTAQSINKPVHILFNKSLQSGIMPQIWKNANITPVYIYICLYKWS